MKTLSELVTQSVLSWRFFFVSLLSAANVLATKLGSDVRGVDPGPTFQVPGCSFVPNDRFTLCNAFPRGSPTPSVQRRERRLYFSTAGGRLYYTVAFVYGSLDWPFESLARSEVEWLQSLSRRLYPGTPIRSQEQ